MVGYCPQCLSITSLYVDDDILCQLGSHFWWNRYSFTLLPKTGSLLQSSGIVSLSQILWNDFSQKLDYYQSNYYRQSVSSTVFLFPIQCLHFYHFSKVKPITSQTYWLVVHHLGAWTVYLRLHHPPLCNWSRNTASLHLHSSISPLSHIPLLSSVLLSTLITIDITPLLFFCYLRLIIPSDRQTLWRVCSTCPDVLTDWTQL